MPNPDLTEIIAIIDRSGSMESIRSDAIGGFNAFLSDQQKLPGKALLTFAQFDDAYEVLHDGTPLAEVSALTEATFVPRGMTALLDAIGRTLNTVAARLAQTPAEDQPGKVIVVILTDGQENASQEFELPTINQMVTARREQDGWEFVFLAADADAFSTAKGLGVDHSVAFAATGVGIRQTMTGISQVVTGYRRSGKITDVDDGDLH